MDFHFSFISVVVVIVYFVVLHINVFFCVLGNWRADSIDCAQLHMNNYLIECCTFFGLSFFVALLHSQCFFSCNFLCF